MRTILFFGTLIVVFIIALRINIGDDDWNALFAVMIESQYTPYEFEQRVFELTNIERENYGLDAFLPHYILSHVARAHSLDMYANDFMAHTGSNGSSVADRVNNWGLTWSIVAENVASGHRTPESVVRDWMESPGHRENILSDMVYMGVGRHGNKTTQKFMSAN